MKRIVSTLLLLGLTGCASMCGFQAHDNTAIAQVKKTVHETPLLCPNYDEADLSLGVIRGGVGSMSTDDIWMTVADPKLYEMLNAAQNAGHLVRVTYSTYRLTFCIPDHIITAVEVVE